MVQSQKGSLDNFIIKKSQKLDDNQNIEVYKDENLNETDLNIERDLILSEEKLSSDCNNNENVNDKIDNTLDVNFGADFMKDIFDPRNWESLDSKMIDVLVVNGPKRDGFIYKGLEMMFLDVFFLHCILEL